MRIQNSFAAAVAAAVSAVVFSAAIQPVEAALVTIDNFTQSTGTNNVTGTSATVVTAAASGASITGPLFDLRDRSSTIVQGGTPRQGRTVLSSVGSGLGTLQVSNSGTTSPVISPNAVFAYTRTAGTADLLAATAGDFAGFKIVTGATNSLSASAAGLIRGYVAVGTNTPSTYSRYDLPSGGFWAPNSTYFIPFASFLGDANFASVDFVEVGFDSNPPSLSGDTAYSAQAQFTLIAVPEPTQIVSVAAVGAMFGAWRLRKLRRSRMTAGDATAG